MKTSLSKLGTLIACPPSASMPRVIVTRPEAEEGRAVHAFLQRVPEMGAERALALVPEEHRTACARLNLARLPLDPNGWAREVAYAYDVVRDSARELCRGKPREEAYAAVRDGELPGTLDVVGVEPARAVVIDYKRGNYDDGPLESHWQLRGGALMVARAYGVERVLVVRCRLRATGEPWYDELELGPRELDETAEVVAEAWARGLRAERELAAGGAPELARGPQCTYCEAFARCPAYVGIAGLALAKASPQAFDVGALTKDSFPAHLEMADRLEQLSKWFRAGVDDLARREGPLEMPSGKLYGQHEHRSGYEVVDGELLEAKLAEWYGPEFARAAIERTTGTGRIQDALRALKETDPTIRLGKDTEKVLAGLCEAGAIRPKVSWPIGEYKPKKLKLAAREEAA